MRAAVAPAEETSALRRAAGAVARVLTPVNTLALWIASLGLVLMTAFVAWQVYGRYVLNASPFWTEAAAIQLMSWFILLGAAVGVRENVHLGFEVLLYVLPAAVGRMLRAFTTALVGGFGAAMAYYGLDLTRGTWSAKIPTLGLPGGFDYLPLVAGGVLICLFSLERLLRIAAGEEI